MNKRKQVLIVHFRPLFLHLFLALCACASAQKNNASPFFTTENDILLLNDSLQRGDSVLTGFQDYKPVVFAQDLGNLSSPYRNMYLAAPARIGFSTGWFVPHDYFNATEKVKYYQARVPYTYASYITGQRPSNALDILQQVKLLHTQNWGPLFNIGGTINSNRCNGFSTNGQARTGSGSLFARFHTPNKRYQVLGNAVFNSASNQINGGIINDSSYENSSGLAKEISGLLSDSSLFRYRGREVNVRQFYRYGKETQRMVQRTVKRDSVVTDTLRDIETRWQVGHRIRFSSEAWVYQDNIRPSENFFAHHYFDTLRTKDTLHKNTFSNTADLGYRFGKNGLAYAAYENRLHWLYLYNTKFHINESFLRLLFEDSIGKCLKWNATTEYCLYNSYREFNTGDHLTSVNLTARLGTFLFKLTGTYAMQAPTLLQVYFPGNHFLWYNDTLEKTRTLSFGALVENERKTTSVRLYSARINNYTFFDSLVAPTQSATVQYNCLQWKQDLKLGPLHYIHNVLLQTVSDAYALPLPKIVLRSTLMYDGQWFKKALHIQFGATVNYFTKYYAPSFMPSVMVFYSKQEKQIGNYPQLDGFVNIRIQRVRIFIAVEHFNQGLAGFGTASYITPHYPIPNRALRFGVGWSFYN